MLKRNTIDDTQTEADQPEQYTKAYQTLIAVGFIDDTKNYGEYRLYRRLTMKFECGGHLTAVVQTWRHSTIVNVEIHGLGIEASRSVQYDYDDARYVTKIKNRAKRLVQKAKGVSAIRVSDTEAYERIRERIIANLKADYGLTDPIIRDGYNRSVYLIVNGYDILVNSNMKAHIKFCSVSAKVDVATMIEIAKALPTHTPTED